MRDIKQLFTASAMLIGTTIGAGFLAIPYVVSQSGFFVGLFYLVFLGLVILYLNLALGEIGLRTQGQHQLTGYAQRYLGKWGKRLMFFSMIFGIYAAILAYLTGVGNSLSYLFFNSIQYSLFFGILIWIILSFFVFHGLEWLKKGMAYGSLIILILIVIFSFSYFSEVDYSNLTTFDSSSIFLPFGVIFFAYLGFSAMPEIQKSLFRKEYLLRRALILGVFVSFLVYSLFTLVMVGAYGISVQEISTFSLGIIVIFLGVITMCTSYFALSVALKDMFSLDYQISKFNSWLVTTLVPLILFLIVNSTKIFSFSEIVSLGGSISGGIAAILILLMLPRSKHAGNRKPEYSIWTSSWILGLLCLIFILGIVYEIFAFLV